MKEFKLITFQAALVQRFQEVDRRYRWRTFRAAQRRLVKLGYTKDQAIYIVDDARDMAFLEAQL